MTERTLSLVTPDTFREAISHHAAGVAVVTAVGPDGPVGLTVSSLSSHSVAPPTLSYGIGRSSTSLTAIRAERRFAVHLLAADQTDVAVRFASRDVDRFAGTAWSWWHGLPTLHGALASFGCDLLTDVEVGNHAIVLGTVGAATVDPDRRPLIHQRRAFHGLTST